MDDKANVLLGWLALQENRLDDAESHFQTAADVRMDFGGMLGAHGLLGLSLVSLRRNRPDEARELSRRALIELRDISPASTVLAEAVAYTAYLDNQTGVHDRAQRLTGAYEAWQATRGGARRIWQVMAWSGLMGRVMPLLPAPTDPVLARARAEGQAMSLEEAVTCALEPVDPVLAQSASCSPASERAAGS